MSKDNMNKEEIKDFALEIAEILDAKKAQDLEVIEISEDSSLADYFVIATGNSSTQVKALADEVDYQIKKRHDIEPKYSEGFSSRRWLLLDYIDVVVHIFNQDARDFYQLDRLWRKEGNLVYSNDDEE